MDDVVKVLKDLPWATLLTLASGYAGYYVANIGFREHHKTIDVTFSVLVFGFFSAFAYELFRRLYGMPAASLIAFVVAVALGIFWSRFGRPWLRYIIRSTDASHTDDTPSALKTLFSQTDIFATQLAVKLKDGTWLHCNDLARFADSPNGPCCFGNDGDLLMYVTHRKNPEDIDFEEMEPVGPADWGVEITYLPKDQIARFDIRRIVRR